MAKEKNTMSFEEALQKLESIVDELETGSVELDKAIKRYQDGMMLAKHCAEILEKAEKKVQICVKEKGQVKLKPFKTKESDE